MKIKIEEGGILPVRAEKGSAGIDLICPSDVMVAAHKRVIIPMAFRIELEPGYEAQIRPRSGCSAKGLPGLYLYDMEKLEAMRDKEREAFIAKTEQRFDADVVLGTIDSTYRGVVGVIVRNHGVLFGIPRGTRIAQMVVSPVWTGDLEQSDALSDTERGEGGFNSTGTR